MIDLYLHVGYGKTGSTYLQSIFRASADTFLHYGIFYPVNSSIQFSGNGHLLYSDSFTDSLPLHHPSISKVLYSREHLTRELAGDAFFPFFDKLLKSRHIRHIYVIMFVRNAFEHCYSLWSQKIKNTTEIRSFKEFSKCYDSLSIASLFLSQAFELGLRVRIVNYSKVKSIEKTFFNWLDPSLPISTLCLPKIPINVSPDYSSLNRMRLYRKFSSDSGQQSILVIIVASFLSLPIFKPRRSLFFAILWRSQIDSFNKTILLNSKSIDHDLPNSVINSLYVSY